MWSVVRLLPGADLAVIELVGWVTATKATGDGTMTTESTTRKYPTLRETVGQQCIGPSYIAYRAQFQFLYSLLANHRRKITHSKNLE